MSMRPQLTRIKKAGAITTIFENKDSFLQKTLSRRVGSHCRSLTIHCDFIKYK